MTVSMWVNANSFGNWNNYLNNYWTGANGSWDVISDSSGQLYFGVESGGVQYQATCSSSASAGQWQFIAGTYDGSTIKIYLNGSLCGTYSLSGQSLYQSTTAPLSQDGAGTPYSIDDVRIYNRALSAAEIQALYTAEH